MSCMNCEDRAEECWEEPPPLTVGGWTTDELLPEPEPCTCCCHDSEDYYRASGDMICARCQKPYRKHEEGGPIGYDGQRFLRRLCNGDLVKL